MHCLCCTLFGPHNSTTSATTYACMLQGEGAACLAVNGCVDLIFGSFDHDDWDDMATRKVADIIYDAALACNLPIQ